MEWAARQMPVLRRIRDRFAEERPLEGVRISACEHLTPETANLVAALKAGGGDVVLCASNPLSTQDAVAAHLTVDVGVRVHAMQGEDRETYYRHIRAALAHRPRLLLDDGADLVGSLHAIALERHDGLAPPLRRWSAEMTTEDRRALADGVVGSTEETTTGVVRLKAMAAEGILQFPVVAVNDSRTKHLFDNRHGTGQSTLEGLLRATNVMLAGSTVVVAGYGWCGRGTALRARRMGAQVVVTEVDPVKALEASMDGFRVMSMAEAARIGDVFLTLTGNRDVVRPEHFRAMRDGAIVANSGHFDVELDLPGLAAAADGQPRRVRESVQEYRVAGKRIHVLGEGRVVNLAAAEGHPASVMDMSFANQALAVEFLSERADGLEPEVHGVPAELDREVASLKLAGMGIEIDELTSRQERYPGSCHLGTRR